MVGVVGKAGKYRRGSVVLVKKLAWIGLIKKVLGGGHV